MADTYEIITDDNEIIERNTRNVGFGINIDGFEKFPVVTQEIEIENDGDVSRPQDQCGNTERRRVGSTGWMITVKGICTSEERRVNNLSMQTIRDVVALSDEVDIIGTVIPPGAKNGITVSNVIISHVSEMVAVQSEDTQGREPAFRFQLQLGEQKSD